MNYTERQNFNVWQSVVKTSFITALSCYYLQVASGNHIKAPRSTAAVKKWSIGVNGDDGTLSLPRGLKTNQAKWYLPIRHRAGRVIILLSCKKEHPQKMMIITALAANDDTRSGGSYCTGDILASSLYRRRHVTHLYKRSTITTKTLLNHTPVKVDVDNRKLCEPYLRIFGLFVGADPSVADLSVPTVGAIRPGEVTGHAHQMAVGFPCAPQAAAWRLHKGTGLGAFSKCQFALTVEAVGGSRQHVREDQGLLGLVEQTFP